MRKIKLLLLFCFIFCCSCTAQEKSKFEWKTFDFSDSGIKFDFPCEPAKKAKVTRTEPKSAYLYSYECKKDNFSFSATLDERPEEFDQAKAKENFDGAEKFLRELMNGKANLSKKDTTFQTYDAREITLENENALGKVLLFFNRRGFYNVIIRSNKKPNQSKEDFNSEFQNTAQQLFDSVKISINK